jgi:hypothetical protein
MGLVPSAAFGLLFGSNPLPNIGSGAPQNEQQSNQMTQRKKSGSFKRR